MKPSPLAISLTQDEKALLDKIELEAINIRGPDQAVPNDDNVAALLALLLQRKAIPEHRLNWFSDTRYNIGGRGASREDIYLRNGHDGASIPRHLHFLAVMRYFLFGPHLPQQAIDAFSKELKD